MDVIKLLTAIVERPQIYEDRNQPIIPPTYADNGNCRVANQQERRPEHWRVPCRGVFWRVANIFPRWSPPQMLRRINAQRSPDCLLHDVVPAANVQKTEPKEAPQRQNCRAQGFLVVREVPEPQGTCAGQYESTRLCRPGLLFRSNAHRIAVVPQMA